MNNEPLFYSISEEVVLNHLLEQSIAGQLIIADDEGIIQYASAHFLDLLPSTPTALIGMSMHELVHHGLDLSTISELAYNLSINRPCIRSIIAPHKQQRFPISVDVTALFDNQLICGYCYTFTPIQDSYSAQESLSEAIPNVKNRNNEGIIDHDLASESLYLSCYWQDQLRYKNPQITEQQWFHCIHPDDFEYYHTHISELLNGDKSTLEINYRLHNPQQQTFWVKDNSFVLRDAQDTPYRIISALENISPTA